MSHAFSDYDLWKARDPAYDYEEPEFECAECADTGWTYPDELCPYCQRERTLEDLEEETEDAYRNEMDRELRIRAHP
jgi:hypothetical protein